MSLRTDYKDWRDGWTLGFLLCRRWPSLAPIVEWLEGWVL